LPTLDELVGREGVEPVPHLLSLTERARPHVFTAHAELEGGQFAGALERLLAGWKAQGYELVSLSSFRRALDGSKLPRHEVVFGQVAGRSGTLALQGRAMQFE